MPYVHSRLSSHRPCAGEPRIFYRSKPMDRRCGAQTLSGNPCRQIIRGEQQKCWQHSGEQCSVCLGYMNTTQTRTLPCTHIFHSRCVERWKTTCHGDPTCPMCRTPFDVPLYRCRLLIERVSDGDINDTMFNSSNVRSIMNGFGVTLERGQEMIHSEIRWDVEAGEDLINELQQLGLPLPPY
jgi:hypothetical protein